jgi:hypothetical protein
LHRAAGDVHFAMAAFTIGIVSEGRVGALVVVTLSRAFNWAV